MTAPTEAEIRAEVIEDGLAWPKGHSYVKQLHELIDDWSASLRSAAWDALESPDPRDPEGDGCLWRDLRPTEAAALQKVVTKAIERAHARCQEVIVEELVAAGVAFATAYPDAPRATREAVPA